MNGALLLVSGMVLFAAAYRFYGRYLDRLFNLDGSRATPAQTRRDGVDYCPTQLPVLFGHHFASIAGAGPIVGPVLAVAMGWGPVVLWVVLGCVFVGGVHDFAAIAISVRHEGRSIGHVIETLLGYAGRQMFLLFAWTALILVVAIFALLVAGTFVATPAVATASLVFMAMAPVFGILVNRRGVPLAPATVVAVPLLFAGIWIGTLFPLDITAVGWSRAAAQQVWLVVLLLYAGVASILPVSLLLQPRDYLNAFLLYAMILAGLGGILVVRPAFETPAFIGWSAELPDGAMAPLFPLLFVTVACGACSGFHSLVGSGTTSKQLASERHIRPIGYGAMLVEGLLALMAVTSVATMSRGDYLSALRTGTPVSLFANGLAGFTRQIGLPQSAGATFFGMAISAFLLTTLDTATRLTRFVWQELFLPRAGTDGAGAPNPLRRVVGGPVAATLIAILLAGTLGTTGSAARIWPVFGASNQLLAALTLLIVALFLARQRLNFRIALIPMVFMMVITVWALIQIFRKNMAPNGEISLVIATGFLLLMSSFLAAQAVRNLFRRPSQST